MRVAGPIARDITWPDGKQFAFTVFDDADFSTVENVGPIYAFLVDHGFLTTKTVWPLAPVKERCSGGGTLEEPSAVPTLKPEGLQMNGSTGLAGDLDSGQAWVM